MKVAVLIANMGGPDSLEAVEPFLYELFNDPDIIDLPLPELIRKPLVRYLAKKRAPKSKQIYEKIGGKTPLLEITENQAKALQSALNDNSDTEFSVYPAMRYWHPSFKEVWQRVMDANFERIVVLSLYPFYSSTTTGSIKNETNRLAEKYSLSEDRLLFIDRYGSHPLFISAIKEQILEKIGNPRPDDPVHLLFSAHSIPMRRINNGDPYFEEIKRAVNLLQKQLPEDKISIHLSFQSKISPVEWLSPATSEKIMQLGLQGVKKLFVYPLGFVADNSETVYEIGIFYRDLARRKGIKDFVRIEALNARPSFIEALKQIVVERIAEKW
ncbi:MAG: ferrochelatase [Calditrichaeota bacterium]|nr:ferrochelatase [Calditrichota bacterium]